jgi:LPXTG-site transpeptidase (sortase) family protein
MTTHKGNFKVGGEQLFDAIEKTWSRKWAFLGVFMLTLVTTTGTMGALDLLPEPLAKREEEPKASISAAASLAVAAPELPTKIQIPAIDMEMQVLNPTSTKVADLDKALLEGTVRYPSSSKLGETGNVIIFGHSSYLPIVRNPSYKAFNNIEDLKKGDKILVTGSARTYVYEVEDVRSADAETDSIPLSVEGSKLTLATCDSFGEKSDRFIVTANLVESYSAGN